MDDGHGRTAHMQVEATGSCVEVCIGRFLDAVTVAGDFSVGEDGMWQFFPLIGQRARFLNENITMAVLLSHARKLAAQRREAILNCAPPPGPDEGHSKQKHLKQRVGIGLQNGRRVWDKAFVAAGNPSWEHWLERLYNLRRDKRGAHERPQEV